MKVPRRSPRGGNLARGRTYCVFPVYLVEMTLVALTFLGNLFPPTRPPVGSVSRKPRESHPRGEPSSIIFILGGETFCCRVSVFFFFLVAPLALHLSRHSRAAAPLLLPGRWLDRVERGGEGEEGEEEEEDIATTWRHGPSRTLSV